MKTNLKQIVPVAAIVLAMAGAFSTHAMNRSKTLAPQQGHVQLDPFGNQCENPVMCETINTGSLCTSGSSQAWGKDGAGKCVVKLYQRINP
jgi:hypothetical protein